MVRIRNYASHACVVHRWKLDRPMAERHYGLGEQEVLQQPPAGEGGRADEQAAQMVPSILRD